MSLPPQPICNGKSSHISNGTGGKVSGLQIEDNHKWSRDQIGFQPSTDFKDSRFSSTFAFVQDLKVNLPPQPGSLGLSICNGKSSHISNGTGGKVSGLRMEDNHKWSRDQIGFQPSTDFKDSRFCSTFAFVQQIFKLITILHEKCDQLTRNVMTL